MLKKIYLIYLHRCALNMFEETPFKNSTIFWGRGVDVLMKQALSTEITTRAVIPTGQLFFCYVSHSEVRPMFFKSTLVAFSLMAADLRIYDIYTVSLLAWKCAFRFLAKVFVTFGWRAEYWLSQTSQPCSSMETFSHDVFSVVCQEVRHMAYILFMLLHRNAVYYILWNLWHQ